jgi:hypothetical protein
MGLDRFGTKLFKLFSGGAKFRIVKKVEMVRMDRGSNGIRRLERTATVLQWRCRGTAGRRQQHPKQKHPSGPLPRTPWEMRGHDHHQANQQTVLPVLQQPKVDHPTPRADLKKLPVVDSPNNPNSGLDKRTNTIPHCMVTVGFFEGRLDPNSLAHGNPLLSAFDRAQFIRFEHTTTDHRLEMLLGEWTLGFFTV